MSVRPRAKLRMGKGVRRHGIGIAPDASFLPFLRWSDRAASSRGRLLGVRMGLRTDADGLVGPAELASRLGEASGGGAAGWPTAWWAEEEGDGSGVAAGGAEDDVVVEVVVAAVWLLAVVVGAGAERVAGGLLAAVGLADEALGGDEALGSTRALGAVCAEAATQMTPWSGWPGAYSVR